MSSRTTSIGGVISLLGAFLASALVLGLLAAGLVMPAVGATGALARSGVDVFNELPSEFTTDPLAQTSPHPRRRRLRHRDAAGAEPHHRAAEQDRADHA